MSETNDLQPSGRRPTPAPKTMPNSPPPDEPSNENDPVEQLLVANEELNARLAELEAANSLLSAQLEASEQARIIAEARVLHLTSVVEESAQDLQQFGQNYFVPMSITSITRDSDGVAMNGILLGSTAMDSRDDPIAEAMRVLANQVNAQKAALRQQAQSSLSVLQPSSQPKTRLDSSGGSGDA